MHTAVIIPAAGSGRRMKMGTNKVLLPLLGQPVLIRTLQVFRKHAAIDRVIVVIREEDRQEVTALLKDWGLDNAVTLVNGGETRQQSVYHGLLALPPHTGWVMVHDAARVLVSAEIISRVLAAVKEKRAVTVGVPVQDTLKRVENGQVVETVPRQGVWVTQTPQAFAYELLLAAHKRAAERGFEGTDDCSLVEAAGAPVYMVEGSYHNFKLTTVEDLRLAEALLAPKKDQGGEKMLVGFGYDVHQLVSGEHLVLCGEHIPFSSGLKGHSDADVAVHALMDALLGAAGLGDIGRHFPDSDPALQGISSLRLLEEVVRKLQDRRLEITNVDVTIVAQRPKIAPFREAMVHNLQQVIRIDKNKINVKATTTEGLGFTGKGEGIAAYAVATLAYS